MTGIADGASAHGRAGLHAPAPPFGARFPDEVVVALHEAGVTLGCVPVRIDDDDWRAALFYVVPPDAPCLGGSPGTPAPTARSAIARTAAASGIESAVASGFPSGAAPRPTGAAASASPSARSAGNPSGTSADPARGQPLAPPPRLVGAPFAVALEADLHEHAAATVIELGIEIRTPGAPLRGSVLFLTGHSSAHFDALTLLAAQPDLPLFIGDQYCRLLASQRVPLGDAERGVFRTLLDEAVGRDAVIRLSGHYDAAAAFDDVLRLGGAAGADTDAAGA